MEKQQVFYIHGGESFENHEDFLERLQTATLWHIPGQSKYGDGKKWTSTLAEDLGEEYEVIFPPMPNKQNAKYIEWKIWFERHFEFLTDGAILIGFSLGAMFLAKYFSENNLRFRPKAVILMAGAYALPGFSDKSCGDFLVAPEKVAKITEKAEKVFILHSKDDFVVPYGHALKYKEVLPEAELVTFEDKNHFLVEELPEVVELIKQVAGE